MDDLSTLLRAASDNAPPTGIDLDGLITLDRRRRRTRWVTAAAAVAVIAVLGAVHLSPGRPRSSPAEVSSPSAAPCTHATMPSSLPDQPVTPLPETQEAAVARLTAELPALLPAGARSTRCPRVEFYYEPKGDDYRASAWVGTGKDEYSLAIMVSPATPGAVPHCLNADGEACTRIGQPGGAIAMADLVGTDTAKPQRSVTVFRPDRTTVLIAVIGRTKALPPATRLATIGSAPGLTLYP
ncbi:hypothetical protein [Paractinoplanes toevensis]|uniref:Uncharacterized protein n=1 Tax=Paractinoplanes toevensis TaxID=571911 RepID=A0A919THF7_9ACTN|nr:hypothetical protein [Actinoplanes toevensis]GIM94154.1 hypothetical protein Ato02nite_059470 [Actinoplanes toevensis]